jgi:DNA ligase-1
VQHLYDSFEEECGFLQFATAITSNDLEEIQKFLDTSVDSRYSFIIRVGKWR